MKKFVSACLMAGLLTCAAGAAQVGTIDNNYPGDTEAQAQMLYDLGLFKGTDKGFALEKSMTRAEASVMLTRLLGAEKTALAGDWKHPFTDVPQWADKYVGWLYQNGLTKGVSATLYGSQRNVTCGQYCIFLTRAHLDADSYQGTAFVDNDEVRQTDEEGFIRGDAVSLSARLLSTNYAKNGDESDRSVAEKLIDDGVFTVEQFKNAAWDVLPRDYSNDYQYDGKWNLIASPFVCQIADVTVAQCPIDGVQPVSGTDRYAQSDMEQSDFILYRMDSKTMKLTQVLSLPQESSVEYLGPCRRNRLSAGVRPENGNVFAVLSARRYGQNRTDPDRSTAAGQHALFIRAYAAASSARTRRPVISSRKQAWSRLTWQRVSAG